MKNNTTINRLPAPISYLEAVLAALDGAHLSPAQARFLLVQRQEDCYYLVFRTDWVKYEAYVSDASGKLLGLNSEPSVDAECLPYRLPEPLDLNAQLRSVC